MAKKEKADPRMEAFLVLEGAFAKHDWQAFEDAAEGLAKAAFEMGASGEEYRPMFKKRKPAPEEPEAPKGAWTVHSLPGEAVRFKQGGEVFTVVRPEGNPMNVNDIVAFCDKRENADLLCRALSAYGGE